MPTPDEILCVEQLTAIIQATSMDDAAKAEQVRTTIAMYQDSIANLGNVLQNFGDINSPVLLSIRNSLPRTFGVLHEAGGHMTQFRKDHRTDNHSYQDLISAMEKVPAFASNTPGQFGYGGIIRAFSNQSYSWLHYYEGELDIEIGAERAQAKADMHSAGIKVSIPVGRERQVEASLVFSRRPSGTLVCRQNEVPVGNTVQEYITNPANGYRRLKPTTR